jgi:hypothetical protein
MIRLRYNGIQNAESKFRTSNYSELASILRSCECDGVTEILSREDEGE